MITVFSNEYYMKQALNEAEKALEADEIPIGAVVVCNDKIIARARWGSRRLPRPSRPR